LAVTVVEGAVQVNTGKEVKDGSFVQASAKKVSRMGPDGAALVLEGDAKLVYSRKGKKIDVATDLLQVNLSTGQVISELDMRPPVPLPTVSDSPPPPVTAPIPAADPRLYRDATVPQRADVPGPSREPIGPSPRPC